MRTFFVFDLREEIISLYKDTPSSLYIILKQILNLNQDNIEYGNTLFRQICRLVDKTSIDRNVFIKLHQEVPYSKRRDTHIYNNLYLDEVTTMIVKNTYVKIESNKDVAYFLKTLSDYSNNFFVCDFKNYDYFLLKDAKMLV
ncbi:MAG: sporulation inhibitor of replication protein SirA [Bacilli bacterium]|nr:sporulation inhibitor of replication protein SirA [Bacilli bacterium]